MPGFNRIFLKKLHFFTASTHGTLFTTARKEQHESRETNQGVDYTFNHWPSAKEIRDKIKMEKTNQTPIKTANN